MSGVACPIECVKDTPSFVKESEGFLLTIVATISGIIGLLLQTCIKSRCTNIKLCGLECIRQPIPVQELNNVNVNNNVENPNNNNNNNNI